MIKDRLLIALTALLFLTGIGTISYVLLRGYFIQEDFKKIGQLSCVTQELNTQMKDTHMNGIINKNEPIRVLIGFYDCNPIKRRDLVYFRISPPIEPVVRMVYGIPGDRFKVIESENENQWNILINDQMITVDGGSYYIQSRHTPPLETYEKSRNGVLGKDEYIILSNVPPGLSDSSNLGLIKNKAFEGKVFKP